MHVTSHFLAVSLDAWCFADLLVDLQTFCREQGIESCLELQNPLSLHVTVYYLPQIISPADLAAIKRSIAQLMTPQIFINDLQSFQREDGKDLYYLAPKASDDLIKINQHFRSEHPNHVSKNDYQYKPHMTLFTVQDPQLFTQYQDQIILLTKTHLQKIGAINVAQEINLYAVNNAFSPQIQHIVAL